MWRYGRGQEAKGGGACLCHVDDGVSSWEMLSRETCAADWPSERKQQCPPPRRESSGKRQVKVRNELSLKALRWGMGKAQRQHHS